MRNSLVFSLLCLFLLAFGQRAAAQCSPDTEPPTSACIVPMDFVLSANQTGTLLAAALSDGSTDNCSSLLSFFLNDGLPAPTLPTASSLDFDADDIGTHDVTLWVVDEAGNASNCATTITVIDDCNGGNSTQSLACNALVSVTVPMGDTLNVYPGEVLEGGPYCSDFQIKLGQNGTYANYLELDEYVTQTYLVTVVDVATGNTCWGQLEVFAFCLNDTVPPVAYCTLFTEVNVALGSEEILATDINDNSVDNCIGVLDFRLEEGTGSATPPTTTSVTFDSDDIGYNSLTMWVIDEAGNSNTCVVNAFVDTCFGGGNVACTDHIDVMLDTGETAIYFPLDFLVGGPYCPNQLAISSALDNYVLHDSLVFSDTDAGSHIVSVTHLLTDNSCWATLNILTACDNDTTPPVPVCDPSNTVLLGQDGFNLTIVQAALLDNSSYDNCSPVHFAVEMGAAPSGTIPTDTSLAFTAVGIYDNVFLWVADESGNTSTCQVTVVIDPPKCSPDNTDPAIIAPASIVSSSTDFEQLVLDFNDNATLDAAFGEATAWDACGNATITQSNEVLYDLCDRVSKITRSFIAWDGAGNNSATATQVIDVNYKYNITLPGDHYPNDLGNPALVELFSVDNSNLLGASYDDTLFDLNNDGNTDRIDRVWTVVNWCLLDLQIPTPVLPRLDQNNDGLVGDSFVVRAHHDFLYLYEGNIITQELAPQVGSVKYTQKIFLTDLPCNIDTVPPVAICAQSIQAQLSINGPNLTILDAQTIDDGSFDTCSIVLFAVEIAAVPSATMPTTTTVSFTAEGVYDNVIMWVADESGNTNYCTITVEIVPPKCNPDQTNPYFTYVPLDTVIHSDDLAAMNLDPQNYQQLNQYFGEAQVWDYCGMDTVLQSIDFITNSCNGIKTITRNFWALDEAGNSTAAQQTITVKYDYSINLPANFNPGDAGQPEEVTFLQGNGSQLAVTYFDYVYEYNCDSNADIIHRTWTVIDWCNLPSGALLLDNLDIDNDGNTGDAYTIWNDGDEVYLLDENGLPAQLLSPFNGSIGNYQYTQIIRYNYNDTISYRWPERFSKTTTPIAASMQTSRAWLAGP
ncbi:MAG: hypothetical protein IPM82_08015 [Saprospiraceae bacterium]|nr:hypothetical protein [Saprospiraceae bacterium]